MSAQNLLARDVLSPSWVFTARPARCGRARFDQVEIASRAAGLGLTKSSSPDDNTSVNSARSTEPGVRGRMGRRATVAILAGAPASAIFGALYKRLVAESPQAQIARPPYPI